MEKQMIKMTYMSGRAKSRRPYSQLRPWLTIGRKHSLRTGLYAQCPVNSAALRVLVQQHRHQARQIVVALLPCHPSIEEESHVKQQADQNR
jgi:hypothetical protein